MFKRFSKWSYVLAAIASGALFHLGCIGNIGGLASSTVLAILQEDLFS
jgi:hypothetical protein